MRTAAALALTLALAAPLSAPLSAQSRVRVDVDTATVTVGDRITLTVSVEHASDAAVTWPDSLDLSPFEVIGARVLPPEASGGTTRSQVAFALAAFELGSLEIPGFEVEVRAADGTVETLVTDRYRVEVVSVGTDESGDIRDIRGPLTIPLGAARALLLALVPLMVAALLYALARRLRPRGEGEDASSGGALPRPAHEMALEALAGLEASGMLQRGEVKEYHIEVSDILRTYVEARFRVDALEMTTVEVLAGLERAGAADGFREGLRAFLGQCDLVKFAKVRPAPEQCRQVLELGRRLVADSIPRPEPVQAEQEPTPVGAGAAAADREPTAPGAEGAS